jgi:hypothetical protein
VENDNQPSLKFGGDNPPSLKLRWIKAKVAHLVEHDLAKVGVAGSSPVFRSESRQAGGVTGFFLERFQRWKVVHKKGQALVVELVDTQDLKSCSPQRECGFNSRLGHIVYKSLIISDLFILISSI